MGKRCWPWDHQWSRTWQKESPGLAQFDKEHFFGMEHKDRDFLQLYTRAAALGMQSYDRSYFCLLNVIFGCVSTEISIQFSTRSFPNRIEYSAFRQKFPKLWTSVAHSFLEQIAQNKNWAYPKATTLPRICKVEMQQASLLYYSAKPQSGGILGCALVCPTSLYVRTIRFPTFCRSLLSVGAYSQYPAWSGCRRSADVPRADHDRVGSSPWKGGFKERVYCACLPSICLIFSTCKYAATAFNFKDKKTINVTDLSWPKTFRYRF